MVVVMQEGAKEEQIQHVIDRLVSMGFDIHRSTGASQTVLGAVGVPRISIRAISKCSTACAKSCASRSLTSWPAARFARRDDCRTCRAACELAARKLSWPRGPARWKRLSKSTVIADRVAKAGAKILRGGASSRAARPTVFRDMAKKA